MPKTKKMPLTDLLDVNGTHDTDPLSTLALEPIPSIRARLIDRFDRSETVAELQDLLDDIIKLERMLEHVGH